MSRSATCRQSETSQCVQCLRSDDSGGKGGLHAGLSFAAGLQLQSTPTHAPCLLSDFVLCYLHAVYGTLKHAQQVAQAANSSRGSGQAMLQHGVQLIGPADQS